jgi:ABC-type amino acid transport substrate-binding protein
MSDSIGANKELKVGLDFAAPIPLHTDIASGNFEGFEVDLMREISAHLGLKLIHKVSLWKDILSKLQEGSLDVVCSAVTATQARKKFMDFSDPYLTFNLCAVMNKQGDKIETPVDLNRKKIGVRESTEAEEYIKAMFNKSNLFLSDTNDELYDLLSERKIALIVDDSPIAGGFVKQKEDLKISFFLPDSESHYAIALKKGNATLRSRINEVLKNIRGNGSYQVMYRKWFGNCDL